MIYKLPIVGDLTKSCLYLRIHGDTLSPSLVDFVLGIWVWQIFSGYFFPPFLYEVRDCRRLNTSLRSFIQEKDNTSTLAIVVIQVR